MSAAVEALVGAVCGLLSGLGIGGGSLLMVWLTAAASVQQQTAQLWNLAYFLPTALGALPFHAKGKQIEWCAVLPAALCGCGAAIGGALLAASFEPTLLRKLFGVFLLAVGIREFLYKNE